MNTGNLQYGISDAGNLLLRLWCGVIFLRYGATLLHPASVGEFSDSLRAAGIPLPLAGAWLCKTSEFIGGAFLVAGFLLKPACLLLIIDMIVATFFFHHGQVLGNGLTTFLLLICMLVVILNGPGPFSLDYLIKTSKKTKHE
jgi:putative oxidoreductase